MTSPTTSDRGRPGNNGRDRDWSWPCWSAEGGWNPYGWNDADQSLFESVWTPAGDALADELIASYGAMWVWLMPTALLTRAPEIAEGIRGLAEQRLINRAHTYSDRPDSVYENAAMYGPFHLTRARRPWADPVPQACPLCGTEFTSGQLNPWILRQYGPARWCAACCFEAKNGSSEPDTPQEVRAAVAELAAALGTVPPQNFADAPVPLDMPAEQRDRIVAALRRCPPHARARAILQVPTWLRVLQETGLVNDAWRPARGTYCTAADGHPARSLGERAVDDWLASHGIAHDLEPVWPPHPELNTTRRRADWKLADGTYVEYAGLNSSAYLAKIEQKRRLATETGITLVVITPPDLANLTALLGPWIPTDAKPLIPATRAAVAPQTATGNPEAASPRRAHSGIGSYARLMAEAKRVARAAAAAGVEQTDFGGEAQGWPLVEGTTTEHPPGTHWAGMRTAEGIMLLTPDGQIVEVWGVQGDSDALGSVNQWGTKPPSMGKLVGNPEEPYAKIAAGLQRLEATARPPVKPSSRRQH